MKTERNILIAFILNFCFSILEFVGGILTNSVAIFSDSIHDLGDAISIGISYFMERVNSRNGIHTIEAASKLGFGTREYELIEVK